MVNSHFGGTAWHAGLIEFVFAGGLLAASLLMGVWGGIEDRLAMVAFSMTGLGAALAGSGLLPSTGFVGFVVLATLMGFMGALGSPAYVSLVQSSVPPESLGRVFALMTSIMSLATPVGFFIAGPLAEVVGVAHWFLISGVVILITGIATYLASRRLPAPVRAGRGTASGEGAS